MTTSTVLPPDQLHHFMGGFAMQMTYDETTVSKPKLPPIDYDRYRDDDDPSDKNGDADDYKPPPPVNFAP